VGSHVGSANDLEVAVSSLGAVTQICFRARAATLANVLTLAEVRRSRSCSTGSVTARSPSPKPRGESAALSPRTQDAHGLVAGPERPAWGRITVVQGELRLVQRGLDPG
jgi:hypothetical protein